MTTTQSEEFIEYVKSKVKFDGDKCKDECDYCSFKQGYYVCRLFLIANHYQEHYRNRYCKKFFND
jgi:hypothetical protein